MAALALAGAMVLGAHPASSEDGYQLLRLDDYYVKWGEPELGSGAVVRYALATGPMRFAGAHNCGEIGPVDGIIAATGITPAEFAKEVVAAFAMWQQVANVSFEPVADPKAANIVIGALGKPQGSAFADVFYDLKSNGSVRMIQKSLVCLSPDQPWKVGFGGDPRAYDLRYAIAHEIGHAIGLDHPGPHGQIMSFAYSETFRTLQRGDADGAVALYGARAVPVAKSESPPVVNISAKSTR